MDIEKPDTKTIAMRIPIELLEKVENDAKKEQRSRTGQILYMITQYYELKKLLDR